MKPEVKELWVNALRSGRYHQTQGALTKINTADGTVGYCCLGVLCDLALRHGVGDMQAQLIPNADGAAIAYEGNTGTLPGIVARWAGLDNGNPGLSGDGECISAASWNDNRGADFNRIADMVEASL